MNDWKFRDSKVAVTVLGINPYLNIPNDYCVDERKCYATVEFELDFECRSDRIKSIEIYINSIDAEIEFEVDGEDMEESVKKDIVERLGAWEDRRGILNFSLPVSYSIQGTNLKTITDEWKIANTLQFDEDGGLAIGELEIDFKSKTITIQ